MKSLMRLFLIGLAATTLSLSGCQKASESQEPSPSSSSAPQKEKKTPDFLTTLPIPSDLKKASDKKGKVETFNYDTKIYDLDGKGTTTVGKKAEVYLPYGYSVKNSYDVLYLMHGGGENERYWLTTEKDTVNVLDNIFAQGLAEPCIIVCPTFYTGTSSSGSIQSEVTDIFQYEFRNDLVPAIEEDYATYCNGDTSLDNLIATREHRGFAGLSMGSMVSIRSALIGNLDICGWISSMSGGYDQNDNDGKNGFAKVEEAIFDTFEDYPVLYWLNQNGTDDIALGPHEALKNLILKDLSDYFIEDENYKWLLFQGGQHNFDAWLVHLYNTLQIFYY